MRDDRVTMLATADAIASSHKWYPLFIFRSGNAVVVYIFGNKVYSKGWNQYGENEYGKDNYGK